MHKDIHMLLLFLSPMLDKLVGGKINILMKVARCYADPDISVQTIFQVKSDTRSLKISSSD